MRILTTLPLLLCLIIVSPAFAQGDDLKLPDCPVALTSFGAAVSGDYLYVYGGNAAAAHTYSQTTQNNVFRRIKLDGKSEWESLGEVPRRQGLALVSYGDKVFRIGGFEATNKDGDDQNLVSTKDFLVYDPQSNEWTSLPDMPEARSSFDAVVMGDHLYVVGGWALNGEAASEWSKTAWKVDLSRDNLKWEQLADPTFVVRANSVGHAQGKVYVVGGMAQRGGPTDAVFSYDPASDSWNEAPNLPEDQMKGFGSSCFNVGGQLVASTANGQIVGLTPDGKQWKELYRMDVGRFFHRLIAIDEHRFAIISGTGSEGRTASVVVFDKRRIATDTSSGDN